MGYRDDLWGEYVKTRDPRVREEIILQNIPLVRHVLGRLAVPALSDDAYRDLVGQGILGLIDAVDRFEPDRGWRFSTYATLRIRGNILDSLRAMDMLPRGARKRVKGIERAISRLRMELRREPLEDEVANAMNLDLKSYRAALVEASCTVMSIDAVIEADEMEIADPRLHPGLTGFDPGGRATPGGGAPGDHDVGQGSPVGCVALAHDGRAGLVPDEELAAPTRRRQRP